MSVVIVWEGRCEREDTVCNVVVGTPDTDGELGRRLGLSAELYDGTESNRLVVMLVLSCSLPPPVGFDDDSAGTVTTVAHVFEEAALSPVQKLTTMTPMQLVVSGVEDAAC